VEKVRINKDHNSLDFKAPKGILASDGISGNFHISCESSDVTVWDTVDVITAGTVSVYYGEGCASSLEVTVIDSQGDQDTFFVPPKNTRSRTYKNIVELKVSCTAAVNQIPCLGSYCIKIHYFLNKNKLC
jgi:hypothetical protein